MSKHIEMFLFPGAPSDEDLELLADMVMMSREEDEVEKKDSFLTEELTEIVDKKCGGGKKKKKKFVDETSKALIEEAMTRVKKEDAEKGGPGSGSWDGPGQPRFARSGGNKPAPPPKSSGRVKTPKPYHGNYYFRSNAEARAWARENGWPENRIIEYERGWAIQSKPGSYYAGPNTKPPSSEAAPAPPPKAPPKGTIKPLRTYDVNKVFTNYVPVARQKGKNEGWRAVNAIIGSTEARIGHDRHNAYKAARKGDLKRSKVYLDLARQLTSELPRLIAMRDKYDKRKKKEDSFVMKVAVSDEELRELEAADISEIMDRVIKAVAKDLGMTEEEVRAIANEEVEEPTEEDGEEEEESEEEKSEGGDNVGMIIQSILLPRGMSVKELRDDEELLWLTAGDFNNGQEFDQYVKFPQMAIEKFDKSSLTLAKVDERGIWVVGGKLLDQKDADHALTIGKSVAQKLAEETSLNLEEFSKGEGPDETNTEGGNDMELFKTKEEFVEAVTEIVKAAFDAKAAADEEAAKAAAAEEEKKKATATQDTKQSVTPDALAALEKTVTELGKSVKELTEKTEKIAQSTVTDPASTQPDDKGKDKEPEKKTVFGGVFLKKRS